MTENEISLLVGFFTSCLISVAKLYKKYDETAPIWKILPAVLVSVLGVAAAASWHIGGAELKRMFFAVLTALATYGAIGRPLKESIRGSSSS